jgi:hypothetical protein
VVGSKLKLSGTPSLVDGVKPTPRWEVLNMASAGRTDRMTGVQQIVTWSAESTPPERECRRRWRREL